MWNTDGGVRMHYGPLHMDVLVLTSQQELIYNCSVRTQDVVRKNCKERWTVGIDGERGPGKSMQAVQLDYDEEEELKPYNCANKLILLI